MRLVLCSLALFLLGSCDVEHAETENELSTFEDNRDLSSTSILQVEALRGSLGAVSPTGTRPVSRTALQLIKDFEGWESRPYNDPAGYCTIGYGHLLALKPCDQIDLGEFADGISKERGEELLVADSSLARAVVERTVSIDLGEDQIGALSSFVFNIGEDRFNKSTMLRLINLEKSKPAASEFDRWIYAGGRVLEGLVQRRACERSLFEGKRLLDTNGTFSRSFCISAGAASDVSSYINIETGEEVTE